MRLLRAELVRIRSRRMTWIIAAVAVGLLGLIVYGIAQTSAPLSAAEQQQAEQAYQQAREQWEQAGPRQKQDCLQAQAQERQTNPSADFHCEEMEPQPEHFGKPEPRFERLWPSAQAPGTLFLGLLALLLGGSWVAAEFTSGSMATWLTYEPRRTRVFLVKTLAAGLVVLVGSALATAAFMAAIYAVLAARGVAIDLDRTVWIDMALAAGRMVAFPVLAGLGGVALAFLARHTAAVSGIAIGAVVVDQWAAGLLGDKARWSLFNNVLAFIDARWEFTYLRCAQGAEARYDCVPITGTIWFAQASAVLGGLVAVALVLAWWSFARRDVA